MSESTEVRGFDPARVEFTIRLRFISKVNGLDAIPYLEKYDLPAYRPIFEIKETEFIRLNAIEVSADPILANDFKFARLAELSVPVSALSKGDLFVDGSTGKIVLRRIEKARALEMYKAWRRVGSGRVCTVTYPDE